MNINELLPIGSIVRLKEGTKKLMIFGVKQTSPDDKGLQSDYIGVLYPEGNMGVQFQYLFNHDTIEEIYFRGFENSERDEFIEALEKIYAQREDDAQ